MQVPAQEIEDLLVPEPGRHAAVDLQGRRLEDDDVGPILEGDDVRVERAPVVGDDRHSASGPELAGDVPAVEQSDGRVPGDRLDGLSLAEALQESHGVPVGVQAVDVVEDHGRSRPSHRSQ